MFSENAFAELTTIVSPVVMQTYVFVMILLVIGGTLFDVWHKKSATYFFNNWRKAQKSGDREVSREEVRGLALQTAMSEVLTSSEFCNEKRRRAHLLTMYGFLLYVVCTIIMVFGYASPDAETPAIFPFFWTIGALMVCAGGYWFWFFIRADVVSEGNSPIRFMQADLFIVSLLASVTFGLIWSFFQVNDSSGTVFFLALYLIATTILFGSIPWSKFSHMFFKPAAALQKRVAEANGSRNNLPPPVDKPETLGSARRQPSHY